MTKEQYDAASNILKKISELKVQLNFVDNKAVYNTDYPFDNMATPYINSYMPDALSNFKTSYTQIIKNQLDILTAQFENL